MPTLSNLWIQTRIHDTVRKYTFNIFKIFLLQKKMNISLHDQGWISKRIFKAEKWIASLIDERQDENRVKSVQNGHHLR
jgi:hypothetical protein